MNRCLFIVVIDDSSTLYPLLEDALSKEGHQVTSFQTPRVALRSILKTGETPRPDLFIVTLGFSPQSGYHVIRFFKNHLASSHIPLIVISQQTGVLVRLQVRLARANAHLEFPFQIQEVVTLVQHFATVPNSNP